MKVLDDLMLTVKARGAIENLDTHTVLMRERLDNVNAYLDGTAVEKGLREPFFPRYFNRRAIDADREGFENIITQHYIENPSIWSWDDKAERFVEKVLDGSEQMARGRAKETVAKIMNEIDDDGLEGAYFGAGRSKHMIHRALDIPNEKIKDKGKIFIINDVLALIHENNKKYYKAINYLKPSLKHWQKVENQFNLAFTFYDLGRLFLELNQLDTALIYLEKGYLIEKSLDSNFISRNYYSLIAEISKKKGNYKNSALM